MWHVILCTAATFLGLAVGWLRGHWVGYGEGRADGQAEGDAFSEIDDVA